MEERSWNREGNMLFFLCICWIWSIDWLQPAERTRRGAVNFSHRAESGFWAKRIDPLIAFHHISTTLFLSLLERWSEGCRRRQKTVRWVLNWGGGKSVFYKQLIIFSHLSLTLRLSNSFSFSPALVAVLVWAPHSLFAFWPLTFSSSQLCLHLLSHHPPDLLLINCWQSRFLSLKQRLMNIFIFSFYFLIKVPTI